VGPSESPFERFIAFRAFGAVLAFSPDAEHVYFVSDLSGQYNLWRVAAGGGWPEQLTAFTDWTVRLAAFARSGDRLAFCADHDGDEFNQIFLADAEGGWPEQITDAPQVQHYVMPGAFSPDGGRLAYAANARTLTDMETWVRDLATGETTPVFGEGRFTFPAGWSPDGSSLLALDLRNNSDTSLHLIDLASGESTELTPHDEPTVFAPGPWRPDGSGFYLVTDEGREFKGLAFYDLAARTYDWVEAPEHDVTDVTLSDDGRVLAWLVNEEGYERLHVRDLESGDELPIGGLPDGVRPALVGAQPPIALSEDGSRVAILLTTPRRPPELYVADICDVHATRVTDSWIGGGIAEEQLCDAQLVGYESFDGRAIPAWLYRPPGIERRPVVLAIHGGPEAQELPLYNALYQYVASRGVAVLATNIRGSTGYGKTYQRLIQRDWGGGDLQDWDYAVRWLRAQDWVDPERIGVFGGSYGGFAVLTCVTRLPDYWAAAVDIFGPSNLLTFARAVPPTWRRMMKQFVGDPDEDAELLTERSPITYIENMQTPLLVIQGAKDPRVVQGESDQVVERLRELGRTVEYIVFEDEGHGFTKKENNIRARKAAADWLLSYLL
jgi:dipeptidyl aminopeptidase/acylaminoacyl peptidase